MQETGQQCQAGTIRKIEGDAGRQINPIVVSTGKHPITLFIKSNHAVAAVVGERVRDVHPDLTMIPAAKLQIHLPLRRGGRSLADGIDHPARRRLTVKDRGWPLQHFHTIQTERFRRPDVIAGAKQPVAIQIRGGIEATHLEPVGVVVGTIETGQYAGTVANRFIQLQHGVLIQLLAINHGDGARGLGHRHFHLHSRTCHHHGFAGFGQLSGGLFGHQWQGDEQTGERKHAEGALLAGSCSVFLRNHIKVSFINELCCFNCYLWSFVTTSPCSMGE